MEAAHHLLLVVQVLQQSIQLLFIDVAVPILRKEHQVRYCLGAVAIATTLTGVYLQNLPEQVSVCIKLL